MITENKTCRDHEEYAHDADIVNIGDIVPGGVVRNTIHDNLLGYTYPFVSSSETHSTIVRYVIRTGNHGKAFDFSVMVVDIGGNCGFCRAYIPGGSKDSIMFGWEIRGCEQARMDYRFEENSWYAFEQGRLRVLSGPHQGKDYIYLKINGELISSFYGDSDSRSFVGEKIYIEASDALCVTRYDEFRIRYFVDGVLWKEQSVQRGLPLRLPPEPQKKGKYFVGWYTGEGNLLSETANQPERDIICVDAAFTEDTVTAVFDPANGGPAVSHLCGRGCLITEPQVPAYSDGIYDYVFAGWKNNGTGKLHDFSSDRIGADTAFTAQYREAEFEVCYYALGKQVWVVSFVRSEPTIRGIEPAVPTIPCTVGEWEPHETDNLHGNMTVHARYTVETPAAVGNIRISVPDNTMIDLTPDYIRRYLSADESGKQALVTEFRSAVNGRQDVQNTCFSWSDDGENKSYTVYFSEDPSFADAFIFQTEKTTLSRSVGVFVPGRTYFWFVCGNDTGACSAVSRFQTAPSPVRCITAGAVANMRDLGGQRTSDGSMVRYGLLYRGAALDETTSHVDEAAAWVFHYLGIRSEIELRGDHMHPYAGWDENDPHVYCIKADGYQSVFALDEEGKSTFRAAFAALAEEQNYPFYFHCSAGADRTGTFAYLLYGLLGIPYTSIRTEYELTSFSRFGQRNAARFSDTDSLDMTCRQMLEQYGNGTDDLQTAVRNFLVSHVGIPDETLKAIRRMLTES